MFTLLEELTTMEITPLFATIVYCNAREGQVRQGNRAAGTHRECLRWHTGDDCRRLGVLHRHLLEAGCCLPTQAE